VIPANPKCGTKAGSNPETTISAAPGMTLAGVVAGTGIAVLAVNVLNWLWGT